MVEVHVDLVADRFAVRRDGRALDLATGEAVTLAVSFRGEAAEQARWAARCARLMGFRHRSLAPLIDYGALG